MKKHVFFQKLLIFLVSVAIIFSLTSCTQQKKPIPSTKSSQTQNKPPKELDALNKAVGKLEKTLSDMYERSKKPLFIQQEEIKKQAGKQAQGGKGQSKGGGGDSSSGGGGGGTSGKGGGGGTSSTGGQQQGQTAKTTPVELVTPKDKLLALQYETEQMKIEIDRANVKQFEQLDKDVIKLHSLWNAFEAKATSPLLMQTAVKDFETSLNNVTKSVSSKDVYLSLMDATQLYKYLPDFYTPYDSGSPQEIGKIRFAAKKINLLGEKDNYNAAKEVLNYLTTTWAQTKPRLGKDKMDMINKIELATSELKSAIDAKNNKVIKAKTEVIIKVADELEKAGSKKSKKS